MEDVPPDVRFEEPWQAQVFALTVALNEAGHFSWQEWTDAFGATLAQHRSDGELNGREDYYRAWLQTLEGVLDRLGIIEVEQAQAMHDRWKQAYLSTPHGAPVRLPE